MSALVHLGYVDVPSVARNGYITKRSRIAVVGDDPTHYPPMIALALNPQMLDWLIESLPERDDFTKQLRELRDDAKETLWDRVAA